jgi:transcriptional regulator with XRE-family HTH domain
MSSINSGYSLTFFCIADTLNPIRISKEYAMGKIVSGKIVSKAKQVRLNYAAHLGRTVTLREVAEAVGITSANLSGIESGKIYPSAATLAKICEFYRVGIADLLEYRRNNSENKESGKSDVVESEENKVPALIGDLTTQSARGAVVPTFAQ